MNAIKLRCLFLIVVLLSAVSCKNHGDKTYNGSDEPIFKSDPELKKITDEIVAAPTDAELFMKRGRMLHKMHIDSLAVKDYKMASSLDTNNAAYYSAIGDLLFDNKDIAGSAQWIQKAINKNPEDQKARLKIAKLFLYIRQHKAAFEQINIVLRKNVYDPEAYFLKGLIYKDIKDTAKAISSFLTALNAAPEYKDAMVQLGLIYSNKKDSLALKFLDNAFKLDTTDVFPIYARGVFYQRSFNFEKAKEEYRRCIMANRHYVDAYFNMGAILMKQDSVQKAYRLYDIATKIDYNNPTAYYNRGVCSERMDSIKNAIKDYRKALELDTAYQSPKEALRSLKALK